MPPFQSVSARHLHIPPDCWLPASQWMLVQKIVFPCQSCFNCPLIGHSSLSPPRVGHCQWLLPEPSLPACFNCGCAGHRRGPWSGGRTIPDCFFLFDPLAFRQCSFLIGIQRRISLPARIQIGQKASTWSIRNWVRPRRAHWAMSSQIPFSISRIFGRRKLTFSRRKVTIFLRMWLPQPAKVRTKIRKFFNIEECKFHPRVAHQHQIAFHAAGTQLRCGHIGVVWPLCLWPLPLAENPHHRCHLRHPNEQWFGHVVWHSIASLCARLMTLS